MLRSDTSSRHAIELASSVDQAIRSTELSHGLVTTLINAYIGTCFELLMNAGSTEKVWREFSGPFRRLRLHFSYVTSAKAGVDG